MFTSARLRIYQAALGGNKDLLLDSGKGIGSKVRLVSFSINVKPMAEQFYIEIVWLNEVFINSGYVAVIKTMELMHHSCHQGKFGAQTVT